jgi:hypothetical protein
MCASSSAALSSHEECEAKSNALLNLFFLLIHSHLGLSEFASLAQVLLTDMNISKISIGALQGKS